MDVRRAVQKAITDSHTCVFRMTRGVIGGRVGPVENVLLTTTGRRSGKERTTPLTVTVDGDRLVLVASNGGARRHPDWYLNLCEQPDVVVERGANRLLMTARTATAGERAELWPKVVRTFRGYEGYQRRAPREIPLVICEPRPEP